MTPEEFAEKMKEIEISFDPEKAHSKADDLLCAVLRELGYEDGIKIFEEMEKWYA
jgi:5'-deoxynucleotidase YfbR-like HD superfamily hydrolase